jgi:hypothetical protein
MLNIFIKKSIWDLGIEKPIIPNLAIVKHEPLKRCNPYSLKNNKNR